MAWLIQYEDLVLAIEPDEDGGFCVRLHDSPFGAGAESFAFPFHREEIETMVWEVGQGLARGPRAGYSSPDRHLRISSGGLAQKAAFQETGIRLFQALFQGTVLETYRVSRERALSLRDHGLRLRILLPTDGDDAVLLQSLPWELLYDKKAEAFLARNPLTPVVRQLALSLVPAVFPEVPEPRLRILIVVASPDGLQPLDDGDERARILEAWPGAEVTVLPAATWRGLLEAVRSAHYHVVHFIAHGSFDDENGLGFLLLETPEGGPHPVSGSLLAETLQASRELRLVFLNSCQTAQAGQDPLLGVAAALVRLGVPAVIAMQFPILDEAARIFSEAVYRSLARGSSLDAAVADGRLSLFQAEPDSWEWITPALLTALSDPRVFRPLGLATAARVAPSPEIPLPREPYGRFCGRQTWLGAILEQLRDPRTNRVIAIQGMGGIGKTALAHEVVHRSLAEGLFDEALWLQAVRPVTAWIDAAVAPSTSMTFEDVLDKILRRCGWTEGAEGVLEEKIQRAITLLQGRRLLLILDNVETAQEPQEEIVRQLLPILAVTPVRLIVTSRKRFEHVVYSVVLAGLDIKESNELLLEEGKQREISAVFRVPQDDLDRIAVATGGSPLAMKLIVGQLQDLKVDDVLDGLLSVRLQWDGEEPKDEEYDRFYRHLFWASWKLLEGHEDARMLLLLLGYYEPLRGVSWSHLLEFSPLREEPKRFRTAMRALWKLSLVETEWPDEKPDDLRYHLHPLTQVFAASMAYQEEPESGAGF